MITHKDMNIRTSGAADDFRNRLVFKGCCCERREREREERERREREREREKERDGEKER